MLLSDDHLAVQDAIRTYVQAEIAPHAAAWDKAHHFPAEQLKARIAAARKAYEAPKAAKPAEGEATKTAEPAAEAKPAEAEAAKPAEGDAAKPAEPAAEPKPETPPAQPPAPGA